MSVLIGIGPMLSYLSGRWRSLVNVSRAAAVRVSAASSRSSAVFGVGTPGDSVSTLQSDASMWPYIIEMRAVARGACVCDAVGGSGRAAATATTARRRGGGVTIRGCCGGLRLCSIRAPLPRMIQRSILALLGGVARGVPAHVGALCRQCCSFAARFIEAAPSLNCASPAEGPLP